MVGHDGLLGEGEAAQPLSKQCGASVLKAVQAFSQRRRRALARPAQALYNDFAAFAVFLEMCMKTLIFALLACAGASVGGYAQASADLAKAKNCMACHAIDKKVLGPAFRDVAAKYKGQKDAETRLVTSITKGSTGVWGAMAMPPNGVSAAEAQSLAKWVLAQK
jgi:cytochrome c